jgi:ArsR family transcriptional regulator
MKLTNADLTVCAPTARHGDSAPTEPPDGLERAARLFRALGDAARLRLVGLLAEGELCVGDIVAAVGARFPTVSQRLRLLRQEGLITSRRDGNHVRYSLADRHVAALVANALVHARECHDEGPCEPDEPRSER